MRKGMFTLGVLAVAALLVTSAFAGSRGVTFTPVGFIEDPGPYPASTVLNSNPAGTEFMVSPSPYGNYCVSWTMEGGWGYHVGQASGLCHLAADGTIMGDGYPAEGPDWPAYWAGTVGVWDPLLPPTEGYEPCGSSQMGIFGMGGNGDYATGLTWQGCSYARAFRYDKATNTSMDLGSMNGDSSRGNAVSDDGNLVVGWTRTLFGNWRGARWDDGTWSWIDGQGNIEPRMCIESGDFCTHGTQCDEYIDDAFCDKAICDAGFCAGGPFDGEACTSDYNCKGYCIGGDNDGDVCTGDYYCPDTEVCIDNPDWNDADYKGEAFDTTADGTRVLGNNYGNSDWQSPDYDWTLWSSAYIEEPDGSFTQIPPPATGFEGDTWSPRQISDDGNVVVGAYGWWIYSFPVIWIRDAGTIDLQLFLVSQGLDELWFWYMTAANSVSADGTIIGGAGNNPENWLEGWVVDISKIKICHAPPGNPGNERTISIGMDSISDHMAHGDFLGTCEFKNSGALSRASDLRPQRPGMSEAVSPDNNPFFRTEEEVKAMDSLLGREAVSEEPQQNEREIRGQRGRTRAGR